MAGVGVESAGLARNFLAANAPAASRAAKKTNFFLPPFFSGLRLRTGTRWTVSIADPSGAPVTGAVLQVSSYMPDHGHYAPTAVAIEQGGGVYRIDDLILPMPGLYAITLALSLSSGEKESVALSLCMTTTS